jgi:hypothetical protein
MDYGRILGRAWRVTWRWKILWILGFLAALGRGGSPGNSSSYSFDGSEWAHPVHADRWPEIAGIVAAVACLGLLIAIALWVVSVIARGGLIAGVQQVEDEDSTSFGRAWRVGVSRFWSLFGISFLTALPVIILVVAGLVALVALGFGTAEAFDISDLAGAGGVTATVLCGGVLCCGGVILAVVLNLLRTFAERAAVLEGLGWIDAIRRGWQVIRENLGHTLIFWVVFLVIGIIFGIVVGGGITILMVPFAALFGSGMLEPGPWLIAPMCFGGLLSALVLALLGSVLEVFTSATWTLAYREMTNLAPTPEPGLSLEPAGES